MKKIVRSLVVFLILFLFPMGVWAETTYGDGTYGEAEYNVGGSTTQAAATSSPTFNTTPPGCTDTVTSAVPDLFEIRTNKDTMVLYFSPPSGEYSSFYIAFSRDPNKWEYGTEYNQGYYPGVLKYTIHLLDSNTTYYVKIRPGNGCATGNWSNTMTAKTTTGSEKVFYKYTKIQTVTSNIKSVISKVIPTKDETETTAEPTVVPTVAEQKQETKSVST
ncbi:MAG: hypothetical protein EOM23_10935, partial [Candidatus Moranbacteria bacterium]|nr:hypothetical protein [Candidatus Moranbacteria bacterium]